MCIQGWQGAVGKYWAQYRRLHQKVGKGETTSLRLMDCIGVLEVQEAEEMAADHRSSGVRIFESS
jgi:hypothetical protein